MPNSCTEEKLEVINSMENMYFHARFLGCSLSDAGYCIVQVVAFQERFTLTHRALQDDDYLILPEVIRTLHTRITELERLSAVYLLPPHERLSSDLRAVYTSDLDGNLHTSFAWLGHGTMIHRSLASEFLSLLQVLEISKERNEDGR